MSAIFFHAIMALGIRNFYTLFIIISQLSVKFRCRDRSGYFNALRPQEKFILFQRLDNGPSNTLPMQFRQNENRE